jgi:methionyl-tRNA synthetase
MADKYRKGVLVGGGTSDGRLRDVATQAVRSYRQDMDAFALEGAVAAAFRIVDAANEYIASTEPWALARDAAHADRLTQVLFDVAEAVRVAAVLLLPVMPRSSAEILRRVGEATAADRVRLDDAAWRADGERTISKGDPLWPRIETGARSIPVDEAKNASQGTPGAAGPAPGPAPAAAAAPAGGDRITIDDFMKVDLRVAKVLSAEKVPNSRKLVKMTIDAGTEQRTLVAGIADAYEPEQLVGRTVVIVFNLKPARLMGIESNGMVLAASPDGGAPTLVAFDQDVPPGTRVR